MQNSLFYPSKKAQWASTRWKKAEDIIAKLQHRITKATLKGNYRKIRNFQRLLVKSLSARLKAVRQDKVHKKIQKRLQFLLCFSAKKRPTFFLQPRKNIFVKFGFKNK